MTGKKKTIRQSIQKMALQVSITALVVTIAVGVVSMLNIKKRVISDSARLGESAAENSAGILKEQIESNLLTITESKAEYASSQFGRLAGYVRQYASYLHYLYLNEEQYNPVEVLPPDNKNAGKLVLMRDFANDNISLPDVKDEIGLLGNVEPMFASAMSVDGDIITTIYLGTESGVMISYDKYSDSGESQGNYNFFESSWYTQAKEAETLIFTDTYLDGYGRGETISCAAPFYDAADNFAGVVSMDVLISDINNSVITMDYVNGAYAFLLDTNGKVIAAPEAFRDTVGNNIVTDDNARLHGIADQILSGESGIAATDQAYYAYAPIEGIDWILGVYFPTSVITEKTDDITAVISENTSDTAQSIQNSILLAITIFVAGFIIIVIGVYFISKVFADRVVQPLLFLQKDVQMISKGNLEHRAKIIQDDEIGELANAFNNMSASLQEYIKNLSSVMAEKERIGAELNVATQIQADMLPSIFPAFPEREEFDIYATMQPAKEVGGDFYDFFLVDEDHLAVVIADVSGKGVPAALFMVIAKTLLKNRAQMGDSPAKVLEVVNNQLCENNKAEMFVTVWFGVMQISTGKIVAANAGHEKPIIRKADGEFEIFKDKHGFVMGAMEGMKYKEYEFEIEKGGCLFVYTDGVPEATSSESELFGMERLVQVLNEEKDAPLPDILKSVKGSIDKFVKDAPQFDDITMLALYRAEDKD